MSDENQYQQNKITSNNNDNNKLVNSIIIRPILSPKSSSSYAGPLMNNDYEIKALSGGDDTLPFLSTKKSSPSHFNVASLGGPSLIQLLFIFVLFVSITCLCSYLYKDSLLNMLLILETMPWWWTALFFCLLFTLVSMPFTWGYILLNIACGFLYGLFYGFFCIIFYVGIGLTISFLVCRYILTRNFCLHMNIKVTFDNNKIIQTLIKILNSQDGYKIVFFK